MEFFIGLFEEAFLVLLGVAFTVLLGYLVLHELSKSSQLTKDIKDLVPFVRDYNKSVEDFQQAYNELRDTLRSGSINKNDVATKLHYYYQMEKIYINKNNEYKKLCGNIHKQLEYYRLRSHSFLSDNHSSLSDNRFYSSSYRMYNNIVSNMKTVSINQLVIQKAMYLVPEFIENIEV